MCSHDLYEIGIIIPVFSGPGQKMHRRVPLRSGSALRGDTMSVEGCEWGVEDRRTGFSLPARFFHPLYYEAIRS